MRLPSSLQRFMLVLLLPPVCLRGDPAGTAAAFSVATLRHHRRLPSLTAAAAAHRGRSSSSSPRSSPGAPSGGQQLRSKRQERVGQLLQAELSQIIQRGVLRLGADPLDAPTRQRISVVRVDVSPDLRQARVAVSIRANPRGSAADGAGAAAPDDGFMAQRRAYSWLVANTKPLRHALAQRISHMKVCPALTFQQVDVGAAVDVMFLLDALGEDGSGTRTDLDFSRPFPEAVGGFGAADDDDADGDGLAEEEEDDDWEEDEDFF